VEALFAAARLEALPLDQDPTARLLGLVEEAPLVLDGTALRSARKSRGMSVSELAEKLSSKGWSVKTADVFRWETQAATDAPVGIASAIAEVLQKSAASLARDGSPDLVTAALRQSDRFHELAERWAKLFNLSVNSAAAALESRVLATVYRGAQPDLDQTFQTLEVLLEELERRERS
jgi:transcriptional regulator with XRE-family HTH domain